MERIGQVTRVDGEWLEITFCRPSDCEKCHACMGGEKETVLRLRGEAQEGDLAQVSIPDSVIAKASALAYLLPLAGLFLGMILGDALYPSERSIGGLFGAIIGIGVPTLWLFLTDKQRQSDPRWSPQLVRIIPPNNQ